jgi:UDP-N-acetylmuramoyl-tripeptide--D-alanyl-D-alanine ligase
MSIRTFIKHTVITILSVEARAVITTRKPHIIGITGSIGKTSTKDAVYALMCESFIARKSKKSFNSEFGVPLTILDLPTGWNNPFVWLANVWRGMWRIISPAHYPAWLILEIGADHPNDIAHATRGMALDIAIITAIGDTPVHVEFFPSVDAVAAEKATLLNALCSGGTAILNGDDARVASLAQTLPQDRHVLLYGTKEHNAVRAENIHIIYTNDKPTGLAFDIVTNNTRYPVTLTHTIGAHHASIALAAFAAATIAGISPDEAVARLGTMASTPGRLCLIEGVRNITLIDDTYNASPLAVAAGLATLHNIKTRGTKIAVLGDMRELGNFTQETHRSLGADVAHSCDMFIAVGTYAKTIAEAAQQSGMDASRITTFSNSSDAAADIDSLIPDGATVFVKGSQGIRMEHIVKVLMAHKEDAATLLVRQEREWKNRETNC